MLIDATHAEETRVVVVDGNKVEEFDFESENKRQLAGNIYLAKVTRVEPSLQAAFVDYGGNRHGFLAFSEIHPDYYQIPVADRQALMEEEAALAAAAAEEDEEREKPKRSRSRSRRKPKTETKETKVADAPAEAAPVEEAPKPADTPREISGMETIDLDEGDDTEAGEPGEGLSPMETVAEAPVAEPIDSVEEVQPEAEEIAEAEAPTVDESVAEPSEDVAKAEVDAPEAAEAEEALVEAAPEVETAEAEAVDTPEETSEDTAGEEDAAPKRPIAADSEDKPVVVSADPEDLPAGDEAEAQADEGEAPAAEDAAEPEAVEAGGEEVSPESDAAEPAAEVEEAAEPVEAEATVAEEAPEVEAPAEEDAQAEAPEAEIAETSDDAPKAAETAAKADAAEADAQAQDAEKAETAEAEAKADASEDDTDEEDQPKAKAKASERDSSIESVADDDTEEEIRPRRKPRPRRYKIQEVIKVRQIMLVQVVKEERGNKGAALTTYLSLAGRYCVLMPNTARGGGISRKITNASDRSKLKSIANEIDVPKGAGLIIRTAGAKRTKTEIKRDYEYLQRLWEQIRELTLKSIAPAKIYEEGDLIKRSIRDLYNREIDEVMVEGERGYRIAKDFMKMIMPSHAKNVKHYTESMPLFARYQVESYLGGMFNPTVQLKSGGYIVIGVTEALVAIDVNSGRATKEGSIEETALKTNLEAAEEVARQLRLRDLAGLIVIDFIDMDERKNNAAVEKRIKEKLKTDRARIQVGRISGFGLMEMSRQRLRPGMIEATTQPCPHCHGTGLIRSDDNMALQVLRQIEEEGTRRRSREVLVKCPVAIANYLMNQKREHIAQIEARYGMSVRVEGDPHLVAPDFSIEKFKTATRVVPDASAPVVSVDTSLMDMIDEEAEAEEAEKPELEEASEEDKPKKRRRRRRRRGGKSREDGAENGADDKADESGEAEAKPEAEDADASEAAEDKPVEAAEGEEKPKKRRSRRSRSRKKSDEGAEAAEAAEPKEGEAQAEAAPAKGAEVEPAAEAVADAEPAVVTEAQEAPAQEPASEEVVEAAETVEPAPVEEPKAEEPKAEEAPAEDTPDDEAKAKPRRTRRKAADVIAEVVGTPVPEAAADVAEAESVAAEPEPVAAEASEPVAEPAEATTEDAKPKRRGWWSLGR
ncbi:Rne/Rng family ribonuclease [Tropicibacter sp. R15_0]|uniref:Rne/Rng family ribonuclease n=1 Tax=Tropicibacter sp. R15_0 TaxID=2821101 RepID=UPI002570E1E6|nr:Rne/Rng family ribonuclease [Tropicibacter sp. R15_0]